MNKPKPTAVVLKGRYPPTTTFVEFDEERGLFYLIMHGKVYIYSSTKTPIFKEGDRICCKFSNDGTKAWANKGGEWAGVFSAPEDDGDS